MTELAWRAMGMASDGRRWRGRRIGYSLDRNSRFENEVSGVQGRQGGL